MRSIWFFRLLAHAQQNGRGDATLFQRMQDRSQVRCDRPFCVICDETNVAIVQNFEPIIAPALNAIDCAGSLLFRSAQSPVLLMKKQPVTGLLFLLRQHVLALACIWLKAMTSASDNSRITHIIFAVRVQGACLSASSSAGLHLFLTGGKDTELGGRAFKFYRRLCSLGSSARSRKQVPTVSPDCRLIVGNRVLFFFKLFVDDTVFERNAIVSPFLFGLNRGQLIASVIAARKDLHCLTNLA